MNETTCKLAVGHGQVNDTFLVCTKLFFEDFAAHKRGLCQVDSIQYIFDEVDTLLT
jgi:hypothetical protein